MKCYDRPLSPPQGKIDGERGFRLIGDEYFGVVLISHRLPRKVCKSYFWSTLDVEELHKKREVGM